jgi:hypothetical protein
MFLGRLANPAIATKCKQDSLDADEVQVELGGRLSPVTTREDRFVQEEQHNVNSNSFKPQHEISDRVRSKFFIDGKWKTPSGSDKLDLISPKPRNSFYADLRLIQNFKVSRARRRSS